MFSSLLLAAALTLGADGPAIIVRPAPPPAKPPVTKPVVPSVMKAAAGPGCACSCGCAENGICFCETAPSSPVKAKAPVPAPPVKASVTTVRAPVGHTHTCPRCGATWDHQANPEHNCPNCGTPQYVQDRVARSVTTTRVATIAAAPAPAPVGYQLPAAFSAAGGCANGSCSAVGRFRR